MGTFFHETEGWIAFVKQRLVEAIILIILVFLACLYHKLIVPLIPEDRIFRYVIKSVEILFSFSIVVQAAKMIWIFVLRPFWSKQSKYPWWLWLTFIKTSMDFHCRRQYLGIGTSERAGHLVTPKFFFCNIAADFCSRWNNPRILAIDLDSVIDLLLPFQIIWDLKYAARTNMAMVFYLRGQSFPLRGIELYQARKIAEKIFIFGP